MKPKTKVLFLMLFLIIPACAGTHVKDSVLLPAVQMAWPKVMGNIERGLMVAVSEEKITMEDSAFVILDLMDSAVKSGIREEIIGVPYNILSPYGYQGIENMIKNEELTTQTAAFLFERLKNFKHALDMLGRKTSYLIFPSKREYWVMTDRGSLYYGTKQPSPTSPFNYPVVSGYMQYHYGRKK